MLGICYPQIDENELEIKQHGTDLFPIGCYHDNLSAEGFPCHWHPELEAACVTEGKVLLKIDQQEYHLQPGDAFFVNTGVLHSVFTEGENTCRLHSFCVHPRLIGGSSESVFWEKYLNPLLENPALPGMVMYKDDPQQAKVSELIEEVWQQAVNEPPAYEFTVREKLSRMILYFWEQTDAIPKSVSGKGRREAERIKTMLEYIHTHFAEDISVEQLAAVAGISKSEVLRCFHRLINTTPIRYVRSFRLRKAAALLSETDWKVIDIALHCGFQEISYFSRAFREEYGDTPMGYRRKKRG